MSVHVKVEQVNSKPSDISDHGQAGRIFGTGLRALVVGGADQAWLFPDDPFLNHDCRVLRASTLEDARAIFDTQTPELVFLPLRMGGVPALSDVKTWLAQAPTTTVVVMATNDEINDAAEAMRHGAFDCLFTPFSRARLAKTVESALRRSLSQGGAKRAAPRPAVPAAALAGPPPKAMPEAPGERAATVPSAQEARQPVSAPPTTPETANELIGQDPTMVPILKTMEAVARSDATVFIQGENGTGKELLARTIHARSARGAARFVPLDCAILRPDTLERDLLGTTPGSDAAAQLAQGGTLYLDEIANLEDRVQGQILRFLQSCAQPGLHPGAGAQGAAGAQADIRIICSTSRNPYDEMREGRLRADLFYRLHVAPMILPPLRARGRDVVRIAEAHLHRLSQTEGRRFTGFSSEAQAMLMAYHWPGNVRQLLNMVWNILLHHDADLVEGWMLPAELSDLRDNQDRPRGPEATRIMIQSRSLAEIEREVIETVIREHGGSIPRAARVLDVSPSTIYRKREAWMRRNDGTD